MLQLLGTESVVRGLDLLQDSSPYGELRDRLKQVNRLKTLEFRYKIYYEILTLD